jgi:hypothetical protein
LRVEGNKNEEWKELEMEMDGVWDGDGVEGKGGRQGEYVFTPEIGTQTLTTFIIKKIPIDQYLNIEYPII